MCHRRPFLPAVLLLSLLLLGGAQDARGDDTDAATLDLSQIQPPGGVPLSPGKPGEAICVEYLKKATERMDSAPAAELTKWVAELERITGKKLDSDLEEMGCRTYFVSRVSVAFDDLKWNAGKADNLLKRAQTLSPAEAAHWTDALAAVLKKKSERPYTVALALIPVEALHADHVYSVARGRKYRARLQQLAAEDVLLWRSKVDRFGGTDLDAALNIVLLDDFFPGEQFLRDKLKATIEANTK